MTTGKFPSFRQVSNGNEGEIMQRNDKKRLIEKKYRELISQKKDEKKHTIEAFFIILFFVLVFVLNAFFKGF